jgi:hypothetical protein
LTCNADGSEKLPIWFIGKAAQPRCFKADRIKDLRALGGVWRYNQKAWMNSVIFKEFLLDFDRKMEGRSVLLLMDNFSAHELAVEELLEAKLLRNTKVMW